MLVGKNPDNEEERVVIVTKNNLAPHPPAMAYTITRNEETGGAVFTWVGESDIDEEQLLTSKSGDERSAIEEAEEFIKDMLKDGDKLVTECQKEAKDHGFSETTINRAKRKMRIRSVKPDKVWYWHLPPVEI